MLFRNSSHFRLVRRKWALTQAELARLVGWKDIRHLSRVERDLRIPSIRALIKYEVLFGTPMRELLPKLYAEVEEEIIREAREMFDQLKGSRSQAGARKRELLVLALKRAIIRTQQQDT